MRRSLDTNRIVESAPGKNGLPEAHSRDFERALGMLSRGDLPGWATALDILERIGPAAVAPLLAELEREPWSALHQGVTEALGRIGHDSAAPALAELLAHRDARRRLAAIRALRRIEKSPRLFVSTLSDADWQVRVEAVFALGDLGANKTRGARAGKRLAPPLVRCLRDPHHRVRAAAANALGRLDATEAVTALRRALADEHRWVASMAEWSLRRLEQPTRRAGSSSPRNRPRSASERLAHGQACELALEMLDDQRAGAKEQALATLERLRCVDAVPRLMEMARREQPELRRKAAWTLGALGPSAREALQALLDDPDEAVQLDAIFALGQLQVRSVAEEVFHVIREDSEEVQTEARRSLTLITGKGKNRGAAAGK